MLEKIEKFLEIINSDKILFQISFWSFVLLIIPTNILETINIYIHIIQYRPTLWIITISSFLLFLGSKFYKLGKTVIESIIKIIESIVEYIARMNAMKHLEDSEKEILTRYMTETKKSISFYVKNSIVYSLVIKKILFESSANVSGKCLFTIKPWAFMYLKRHPEKLT